VMKSRLCAGVAALLLSVSASSGADITVGFVTSLSGPGASIGIPYEKGVLAAHAYAGKVGDVNIKLIRLDDASDPSAATRNARKLVEQEKVTVPAGTSGVRSAKKKRSVSWVAHRASRVQSQWLWSLPRPRRG